MMKLRTKLVLMNVVLLAIIGIMMFMTGKKPEAPTVPHAINTEPDQPGQVMLIQADLKPEEIEAERLRRAPTLQNWLEGVGVILEKTKDPRAIELLNALAVSVLSKPVEQGVLFLEPLSNQDFWIAVTPVLPEDEKFVKQPGRNAAYAGATFSPENNVLFLFSAEMTKEWRGILFLHELDHADRYFTNRYNWKDIRTFCHEERKVHEDQNRWVSQLGGQEYETLVDAEVERQKKFLSEEGREIGTAFLDREDYNPKLDEIFDKALSLQEKDFRMTQIWIHAQFTLLDRLSELPQDEKDERKAFFLKTIYNRAGVLDQLNK